MESYYLYKLQEQAQAEGLEGVKWELGSAGIALGKWGSSHTGTGIWSLGMGKK